MRRKISKDSWRFGVGKFSHLNVVLPIWCLAVAQLNIKQRLKHQLQRIPLLNYFDLYNKQKGQLVKEQIGRQASNRCTKETNVRLKGSIDQSELTEAPI